jgi:hypothetical protein
MKVRPERKAKQHDGETGTSPNGQRSSRASDSEAERAATDRERRALQDARKQRLQSAGGSDSGRRAVTSKSAKVAPKRRKKAGKKKKRIKKRWFDALFSVRGLLLFALALWLAGFMRIFIHSHNHVLAQQPTPGNAKTGSTAAQQQVIDAKKIATARQLDAQVVNSIAPAANIAAAPAAPAAASHAATTTVAAAAPVLAVPATPAPTPTTPVPSPAVTKPKAAGIAGLFKSVLHSMEITRGAAVAAVDKSVLPTTPTLAAVAAVVMTPEVEKDLVIPRLKLDNKQDLAGTFKEQPEPVDLCKPREKRVIVYKKELFPPSVYQPKDPKQRFNNGGPAGELVLFWSVLHGLKYLAGVDTVLIANMTHLKQALADPYSLIFLDEYGMDDLKKMAGPKWKDTKCRLRFMDFWGTPSNQNHEGLNQEQFLVPYPDRSRIFGNYFIGLLPALQQMDTNSKKDCTHFVESPLTVKPKKNQGVLYGKLDRYFTVHLKLIEALAKVAELHAVIAKEQMKSPQLRATFVKAKVVNHGFLSKEKWIEILEQVQPSRRAVPPPRSFPLRAPAHSPPSPFSTPSTPLPPLRSFYLPTSSRFPHSAVCVHYRIRGPYPRAHST